MRTAILSDIHGNLEAFEAVLADMDRQAPDDVINLGDAVGYGPDPEAVLALLDVRGVESVMGNHEHGLTTPGGRLWFNPTSRRALDRTGQLLSPAWRSRIAAWPLYLVRRGVRYVHGMPPDKPRVYLFERDDQELVQDFATFPEALCFVGHTHMLEYAGFDGRGLVRGELDEGLFSLEPERRYLINPGSVGQPRDGDRRAKYALFDEAARTVEIRFIPYDNKKTAEKILARGMPEQFARRLL